MIKNLRKNSNKWFQKRILEPKKNKKHKIYFKLKELIYFITDIFKHNFY